MPLESVLNVLFTLNEYSWTKNGSLRDAELQCNVVRHGLHSVHQLLPVVEEFCHPAKSTAMNSKLSFQNVHEDRMVNGVEGGQQIEQD